MWYLFRPSHCAAAWQLWWARVCGEGGAERAVWRWGCFQLVAPCCAEAAQLVLLCLGTGLWVAVAAVRCVDVLCGSLLSVGIGCRWVSIWQVMVLTHGYHSCSVTDAGTAQRAMPIPKSAPCVLLYDCLFCALLLVLVASTDVRRVGVV